PHLHSGHEAGALEIEALLAIADRAEVAVHVEDGERVAALQDMRTVLGDRRRGQYLILPAFEENAVFAFHPSDVGGCWSTWGIHLHRGGRIVSSGRLEVAYLRPFDRVRVLYGLIRLEIVFGHPLDGEALIEV